MEIKTIPIEDVPEELLVARPEKPDAFELHERLERVLNALSIREGKIVRLRYGLTETGKCLTLGVIGRKFGITVERVRQILHKAERKLGHPMRKLEQFLAP
jgi:RNA polymerase primary sigma factor